MARFSPLTLSVTLACVSSVLAGLFPTSPVANTIWTAGRSTSISWMDDKSHPHLDRLGPLNIVLYSGNDNLVATLAKDVDPADKSREVWVSPSWGHNGSDYYITFSSQNPPADVYTASFTIVGMSDLSPLEQPNNSPGYGTDSLSPAYYTHSPSNASSTPFATSTSSAQASSTLLPISPDQEADWLRKHRQSTSGAVGTIDYERLKFRLVFILWPALVGITMAL